jgi:hypothetical protein
MNTTTRIVWLLVCALAGCSQPPAEDEVSSTLLNAPSDPGHKFDVGICIGALNADGTCAGGACSGTLIAPNLVLTAQHCVHQINYADTWCGSTFSTDMVNSALRVTTSDSVQVGAPKWYSVQSFDVPATNGLCTDDLAMLILSTPVPPSEASPVWVNDIGDFAKHAPAEVAIVGRGAISDLLDLTTFNETVVDGSLTRRIAQHVPFHCATDDASKPCSVVDYSSPPSNVFDSPPTYYVIGASVAPGDSGSGVFTQRSFNTAARAVIGVAVASTYGADGHPDFGLVTRLDTHRAFILQGLRDAAHAAGLSDNGFGNREIDD